MDFMLTNESGLSYIFRRNSEFHQGIMSGKVSIQVTHIENSFKENVCTNWFRRGDLNDYLYACDQAWKDFKKTCPNWMNNDKIIAILVCES
jgi:hypothetical protein